MNLADIFNDYTLRTILLSTGLFGICSALIGCFTFMQKQSLLGDVISHATFPGIVCAFFITKSKQPLILLTGGICSALLGTMLMHVIIKRTTLKKDAALGIVLSVFFGFGLVLITWLQHYPGVQHGLLIKYIFGNATTLMQEDLYLIMAITVITMSVIYFFWHACVLTIFDAHYAQSVGYSSSIIHNILIILTIMCIITGLQLVGVVLMSSFLIAPAAAARQWTHRFDRMVILAMIFGLVSALSGTLISAHIRQMPTGPMIVVMASSIVGISLLIAPRYGLINKIKRHIFTKKHMPECPSNTHVQDNS